MVRIKDIAKVELSQQAFTTVFRAERQEGGAR